MLKKLLSEAHWVLRITTTGPILIKSGYATISGPDMTPVLTYRNGQPELYLPGSSLKGVFRSHLEKVVCSLKSQVVCNPFLRSREEQRQDRNAAEMTREALRDYRYSCGDRFEKRIRDDEKFAEMTGVIYEQSCPTCRLFGSTSFIGRVAISDANLVSKAGEEGIERVERRDGIGIDRLTGGTSRGAKFELEVVTAGVTFETTIHLRNFEIWQLGMLFVVIQDMEDQLIRIGSGRSRGLGRISAEIDEQERDWHRGGVTASIMRGREPGSDQEPEKELWGLGRWLNDGKSYGTRKDDLLVLSEPVPRRDRGIRSLRSFKGRALDALKEAAIEQFITRMQQWPVTNLETAQASPPTAPQQRR